MNLSSKQNAELKIIQHRMDAYFTRIFTVLMKIDNSRDLSKKLKIVNAEKIFEKYKYDFLTKHFFEQALIKNQSNPTFDQIKKYIVTFYKQKGINMDILINDPYMTEERRKSKVNTEAELQLKAEKRRARDQLVEEGMRSGKIVNIRTFSKGPKIK